ncbi:hypothetical protein TWF703_001451 [Orbilia oligospora]|uniref:Uncharacterized protein n=1 Tax=Orbilia oligospora TaxID=2813651 RepID=A0A7C8JGW4_ORBOL|nr:hypothetical protein TWF703_001451 [Orbilia oligospora]
MASGSSYHTVAASGTSTVVPRSQGSSWASIVSGQPSRPRISSSTSTGLRAQRNGSYANLSEIGSQSGRYYNTALSNAFNTQSKLSRLPVSLPSYLEDSLYAERLDAVRDSSWGSTVPSRTPSYTSVGLHAAQSRGTGLKLDVKDTVSSPDDDLPTPLPTKWNENDRSGGIEVSQDGLDVQFPGPSKVNEYDSASVRADYFIPRSCGVYYYEVAIMNKSREGLISIGFCGGDVQLNRLPGWEPNSWGYHGDDGKSFCCSGMGKAYGPQFNTKDVIGCGINFRTHTAFFTRNGQMLGTAFRDIPNDKKLFPAVGMKKPGEHIRVNFGQEEFSFDIDGYMKAERKSALQEISDSQVESLCPPLDEAALIQSLISSYLQHDGFVETAKAFAQDLQAEQNALSNNGKSKPIELMEDENAIHRQSQISFCMIMRDYSVDHIVDIRTAILDGDIDKALELTHKHYPDVLTTNEHINFRIRCRKFIEMMRQSAETTNGRKKVPVSASKRRAFETYEDEDVDMDGGDARSDMDLDEPTPITGPAAPDLDMLGRVLDYGRQLQEDFKEKPELQEEMEQVFSLFAYSDPMTSPMAHLLSEDGRGPVAEALNSAILVSLGKSSKAPLERLVQQTTVLLRELGEEGGPASFVNIHHWIHNLEFLPHS